MLQLTVHIPGKRNQIAKQLKLEQKTWEAVLLESLKKKKKSEDVINLSKFLHSEWGSLIKSSVQLCS